VGCVLAAVEELPVWESSDVEQVRLACCQWLGSKGAQSASKRGFEPTGRLHTLRAPTTTTTTTATTHTHTQDALLLMELVQQLGAACWVVALSVLLVDMSVLGPLAAAQPQLWAAFCGQLMEQPRLYFLHQLVSALADGGDDNGGEGQGAGYDDVDGDDVLDVDAEQEEQESLEEQRRLLLPPPPASLWRRTARRDE
jgi:hypothetical protein